MHVSLVSFGGMVLVALSVLGTGAPCFSSIPLTVSDHFVLLSVHAIVAFGIIFLPHFPIPRTPYISFASGLRLVCAAYFHSSTRSLFGQFLYLFPHFNIRLQISR